MRSTLTQPRNPADSSRSRRLHAENIVCIVRNATQTKFVDQVLLFNRHYTFTESIITRFVILFVTLPPASSSWHRQTAGCPWPHSAVSAHSTRCNTDSESTRPHPRQRPSERPPRCPRSATPRRRMPRCAASVLPSLRRPAKHVGTGMLIISMGRRRTRCRLLHVTLHSGCEFKADLFV